MPLTLYLSQVKFPESELVLNIGSFIRCWDVSVGVLARDVGTAALPTQLKEDIQLEKRIRLGNIVCVCFFHSVFIAYSVRDSVFN